MSTATAPTGAAPTRAARPAPGRAAPKPASERPTAAATSPSAFSISDIDEGQGHRVVVYGPGGIGKTWLACHAPGPVVFFDFEASLPKLRENLHKAGVEKPGVVRGVSTWQHLRDAINGGAASNAKTIVIDSLTMAEELAIAHTLATVPHPDDKRKINRIEDYGYGKGYMFVYETMLMLLGDLDAQCRAGRNVILIAHECSSNAANPHGSDWLRFEPRLQNPPSGKASIRLRVKEWADHVLFFGYYTAAEKGRASGVQVKQICPVEEAYFMAKSRSVRDKIDVDDDTNFREVWASILK